MTGWFVDGDKFYNPQGKAIGTIDKRLSSIEREEFREHLEDGIRKAVAAARYEWEHEHEIPTIGRAANNGSSLQRAHCFR